MKRGTVRCRIIKDIEERKQNRKPRIKPKNERKEKEQGRREVEN